MDGAYLGGTTTGINGIKVSTYIYKGSASAGKLDLGFLRNRDGSLLTQEDFDTIVAAVVGEASKKHNLEEAYAIADVIMNRANYTQETAAHIVKSSGIRGYNDESITRVSKNEMLNIDKGITNARAAVIDAFIGTVDSSNGAYFWDGKDIAITDRNDRLYNPHRDWGLFYTSSTHDIHHTGNILFPDIICYYELENGKQGGFRGKYNHIFDSTAAYGDTVFWKYNPDFMRAEGNKEYP